MSFGERLTTLRKSKGLSQEQLAERLNLTRQTISKWELDQSTPDMDYLVALSDYFEVTTDYLIKGEPPTASNRTGSEAPAQSHHFHKRCFYLGLVMMGICFIGILAFVLSSALTPPWTVIKNDRVYTGLLGFLVGTNTIWFFRLLPIMSICGCMLTVYGLVNCLKTKK